MKWIMCCAGATLIAAPCFAQATYKSPTGTSATNGNYGTTGTTQSMQFCRSKDLVGADIKDAQGQKIGDINEVYINPRSGETLATVDLSGHRYGVVPIQAFQVVAPAGTFRNAQVTLNKTKAELESGPVITGNDWQKLDDPTFTRSVYSHYNIQQPAAVGSASSPGGTSTGTSSGHLPK